MKYLPVCLVGLFLLITGGVASRVLFPVPVEEQAPRLLKRAGIEGTDEQFDQYFISLSGVAPGASGKPVTLSHINGNIWGAKTDLPKVKAITKEPLPKFTASFKDDGVVELVGVVHSNRFKRSLETAAENAIGTRAVESRLTVNKELGDPEWESAGPGFLRKFLSFSGVSGITANRDGLTLEGEVLSREVREKLGEQAAVMVSAPAVVKNNLSVIPSQNPSFKLHGSPSGLKISGLLPDELTRRNLIAVIQRALPDREFKDEIKIAGGVAKPWWLPNAESLIPMFLKETNGHGTVAYWKNRLHVVGDVGSEAFKTQLTSVPFGPEKPDDFSMQSDLSLRADQNPNVSIHKDSKGRLIAQGTVGVTAVKDQIMAALIQDHPDMIVFDQLTVDDQVRDYGWSTPAKLISELVFHAKEGAVKINTMEVEIQGEVESEEKKTLIAGLAADVVGSYGNVINSLTVTEVPIEEPAPVEDPTIDFKEYAVYFDSGSYRVKSSQYADVTKTAELIKLLNPKTKLIVGGYADNRGNQSANKRLSGKRATAVRDRLVSLGVDKSRMVIKTYGEDVSNVSRRNLWKSRRVELSIDRE